MFADSTLPYTSINATTFKKRQIKTKKQIHALQQTIQALENEKARLAREIEQLRATPLALEKKAREDLWLMKKNEKVVVLVQETPEAKHE